MRRLVRWRLRALPASATPNSLPLNCSALDRFYRLKIVRWHRLLPCQTGRLDFFEVEQTSELTRPNDASRDSPASCVLYELGIFGSAYSDNGTRAHSSRPSSHRERPTTVDHWRPLALGDSDFPVDPHRLAGSRCDRLGSLIHVFGLPR